MIVPVEEQDLFVRCKGSTSEIAVDRSSDSGIEYDGQSPGCSIENFPNENVIKYHPTIINEFDILGALSASERRYIGLDAMIVFHAAFEYAFNRNNDSKENHDLWCLVPVEQRHIHQIVPTDFLNSVKFAKVRFKCSDCKRCWTSKNTVSIFFYPPQYAIHREKNIFFSLKNQVCSGCNKHMHPLWYPDEVWRVLLELSSQLEKEYAYEQFEFFNSNK